MHFYSRLLFCFCFSIMLGACKDSPSPIPEPSFNLQMSINGYYDTQQKLGAIILVKVQELSLDTLSKFGIITGDNENVLIDNALQHIQVTDQQTISALPHSELFYLVPMREDKTYYTRTYLNDNGQITYSPALELKPERGSNKSCRISTSRYERFGLQSITRRTYGYGYSNDILRYTSFGSYHAPGSYTSDSESAIIQKGDTLFKVWSGPYYPFTQISFLDYDNYPYVVYSENQIKSRHLEYVLADDIDYYYDYQLNENIITEIAVSSSNESRSNYDSTIYELNDEGNIIERKSYHVTSTSIELFSRYRYTHKDELNYLKWERGIPTLESFVNKNLIDETYRFNLTTQEFELLADHPTDPNVTYEEVIVGCD